MLEIAQRFNLGEEWKKPRQIVEILDLIIGEGQIIFITGGSGSGKTTVLQTIQECLDGHFLDANKILPPAKMSVIDSFCNLSIQETLKLLNCACLIDPKALLCLTENLSVSEYRRLQLAITLSLRPKIICIDNFCDGFDRICAAMLSSKVRQLATERNITFILTTSQDDILDDLKPDVTLIKHMTGHRPSSPCSVIYLHPPLEGATECKQFKLRESKLQIGEEKPMGTSTA